MQIEGYGCSRRDCAIVRALRSSNEGWVCRLSCHVAISCVAFQDV